MAKRSESDDTAPLWFLLGSILTGGALISVLAASDAAKAQKQHPCPKCHQPVPPKAAFCPTCGSALAWVRPSVAA